MTDTSRASPGAVRRASIRPAVKRLTPACIPTSMAETSGLAAMTAITLVALLRLSPTMAVPLLRPALDTQHWGPNFLRAYA